MNPLSALWNIVFLSAFKTKQQYVVRVSLLKLQIRTKINLPYMIYLSFHSYTKIRFKTVGVNFQKYCFVTVWKESLQISYSSRSFRSQEIQNILTNHKVSFGFGSELLFFSTFFFLFSNTQIPDHFLNSRMKICLRLNYQIVLWLTCQFKCVSAEDK